MTKDKQTAIRNLLFRASSVYPECKLTDEGIDVYCGILQEYDLECIGLSIKECIKTLKFFPKVSEIIEHAQPFIKRKTLVITDQRYNDADFMRKQDDLRRENKNEQKREA